MEREGKEGKAVPEGPQSEGKMKICGRKGVGFGSSSKPLLSPAVYQVLCGTENVVAMPKPQPALTLLIFMIQERKEIEFRDEAGVINTARELGKESSTSTAVECGKEAGISRVGGTVMGSQESRSQTAGD